MKKAVLKMSGIKLKPSQVHKMRGFIGGFRTNFEIPDLCGLGKSVSRGYGTVKRVEGEKK